MPYRSQWFRRRMQRRRGRLMRWMKAWQGGEEPGERAADRRRQSRAHPGADYDEAERRAARGRDDNIADYDKVTAVSGQARKKPTSSRTGARRASAQDKRKLLFSIFDAMEGSDEEFIADGRPRVENVNDRAKALGFTEADFGREEIDKAFEAWQSRSD